MGIHAEKSQLITSTHASIKYLLENFAGKLLYALGTDAFCAELSDGGLNITRRLEHGIAAIIMGYDTELNFQKLEDACILLNRGAEFFATNPDLVCPTEYGYVPDCGSVAQMLENATGRKPVYMGKPQPNMALMALEQENIRPEHAVLIGDRQYTDIACGIAAGIDTALVLSGETKRENIGKSQFQPTHIFENVGEVF
jgi:HAD superfamily hydrolase (TIGR01450 family)